MISSNALESCSCSSKIMTRPMVSPPMIDDQNYDDNYKCSQSLGCLVVCLNAFILLDISLSSSGRRYAGIEFEQRVENSMTRHASY